MEEDIGAEIDKVEPENIVEVYALFGLHGREHNHSVKIGELNREFDGDIRGAILQLWNDDRLLYRQDENRVRLRKEEKDLAREIADTMYYGTATASDVVESDELPDYILEPDTSEQFNAREPLDQDPGEELYIRIIEVLSGGRALSPERVEEELAVDINFDLEPKLKYMETQNAAIRREDGLYELLPGNIDDEFFDEGLNEKGVLQEQQRYRNNPWKS